MHFHASDNKHKKFCACYGCFQRRFNLFKKCHCAILMNKAVNHNVRPLKHTSRDLRIDQEMVMKAVKKICVCPRLCFVRFNRK